MRPTALLLAGLLMTAPHMAFAHAHLVSSDPAVGGTSAATNSLKLTFSEGLELKLSKFDVTAETGPVAGITPAIDGGDAKAIVLKLAKPLGPGTYEVHWHVVSVDSHRTEGTYSFTIK